MSVSIVNLKTVERPLYKPTMTNDIQYLIKIAKNANQRGFCTLVPVEGKIRFECQQCGRCCRLATILLTERDLEIPVLEENSAVHPPFFQLKKKGNRCTFLKNYNNKYICSVNSDKPLCCRCYPFFYISDQLYVDKNCPGVGKGSRLSKDQLYKIIALRKEMIRDFDTKLGDSILEKSILSKLVSNSSKTSIRGKNYAR
jgi:Fe-S-cluster containining protein